MDCNGRHSIIDQRNKQNVYKWRTLESGSDKTPLTMIVEVRSLQKSDIHEEGHLWGVNDKQNIMTLVIIEHRGRFG